MKNGNTVTSYEHTVGHDSVVLSRGVTQGSQEHRTRRRGTYLNTLYFNTEQRSRDTGTHTNDVKT